ncbi:CRR6 family NdhI maturation factor [Lusitaniella coriacea]|uniref:CRR6 family NdhI maturation factor n=1 Tax=Lusitaniella coriacea TaxID=1983105 RepID=UPI003CEC04E3
MSVKIHLNSEQIHALDLSPVEEKIEDYLEKGRIADYEQKVSFELNYPRDPSDPRELSEIPEIRLWFVRLDARYPWFLYLLDGKTGELYRYIAMLVPHQFNRAEGIQYNPEALEIFAMKKIFVLHDWLKKQNITSTLKLKAIAQSLGFDLDDTLFNLLG